jgi:hypothetical protein
MTTPEPPPRRFRAPGPVTRDRLVIGVAALAALVTALTVREDERASNLSLVLAATAGLLALVAMLLPYLKGLSGTFGGVGLSLDFTEASSSEDTRKVSGFAGLLDPQTGQAVGKATVASGSTGLVAALDGPHVDFVVVDLGHGERWLVSRLLVFTAVLQQLRGVECVVFTSVSGARAESRYLGMVAADDLRRAIAWHYPWLERALFDAWTSLIQPAAPLDPVSGLDPSSAERLYRTYVERIRDANPGPDKENWTELQATDHEHSPAVTGALIADLLGPELDTRAVTESKSPGKQVDEVMAVDASYVAIVDRARRFLTVTDRQALLEELAAAH